MFKVFPKRIVVPQSVTIRSAHNSMILSTTLNSSTLQTSNLNLDVDTLVLQGANDTVKLSGGLSNFIVSNTSGNVQQPDHSTMNNDYVFWLSPSAGGQTGRTVNLKPLTAEYVNNLRFTLRNDSGATFTVSSLLNTIYGNATIETNTAVHYSSILVGPDSFAWIALGPTVQVAVVPGGGGLLISS